MITTWCQCYSREHFPFQFRFLRSYPNFQVLGFNGGAIAVAGEAAGNGDNRSGRGLHGSLRHLPEPPRRLQFGYGILRSQTPRLFRFHLATLLQVTIPSPSIRFDSSHFAFCYWITELKRNVAASSGTSNFLSIRVETARGRCIWPDTPRCDNSSFSIPSFSSFANRLSLATTCSSAKIIFSSHRLASVSKLILNVI